MRAVRPLLLLTAALTTCAPALAASSSFDADAEGWTTAFNGSEPVLWSADGFIDAHDSTDDWAYLKAPDSFHAPMAAGGSFSFDLRHALTAGDRRDYGVLVALTGGGLTLIAEGGIPTDAWQRHVFALTEGVGWRSFSDTQRDYSASAPAADLAALNTVLAALTGVYIATDYTNGNRANGRIDRSFIDNVQLLAAPVPEPGPWAMLAAGMVVLGWLSRRRGS